MQQPAGSKLLPEAGSEGPHLVIVQAKWNALSALSSAEMTARTPRVQEELEAVKQEFAAQQQERMQTLKKLEVRSFVISAYSDANAKFAEQLQRDGLYPELVCA